MIPKKLLFIFIILLLFIKRLLGPLKKLYITFLKMGTTDSEKCTYRSSGERKRKTHRARTLRFIEENGGTRCKRFWSDLKRRRKKSGCIMEIKSQEGELLTEAEDVKEVLGGIWEKIRSTGLWHIEQEDLWEVFGEEFVAGKDNEISMEEIMH